MWCVQCMQKGGSDLNTSQTTWGKQSWKAHKYCERKARIVREQQFISLNCLMNLVVCISKFFVRLHMVYASPQKLARLLSMSGSFYMLHLQMCPILLREYAFQGMHNSTSETVLFQRLQFHCTFGWASLISNMFPTAVSYVEFCMTCAKLSSIMPSVGIHIVHLLFNWYNVYDVIDNENN